MLMPLCFDEPALLSRTDVSWPTSRLCTRNIDDADLLGYEQRQLMTAAARDRLDPSDPAAAFYGTVYAR